MRLKAIICPLCQQHIRTNNHHLARSYEHIMDVHGYTRDAARELLIASGQVRAGVSLEECMRDEAALRAVSR